MISKKEIERNLRALDARYRTATKSQKDPFFFSKLAILELCGWIEMSMDDIVLRSSVRKLGNPANRNYVVSQVVRRTHSFEYNEHFRVMVTRLIGLVAFEKLEARLDPATLVRLKAELNALKQRRDPVAHTFLKGVTHSIDAPSVTLSRFHAVYEGLKEFEREMKKLGF